MVVLLPLKGLENILSYIQSDDKSWLLKEFFEVNDKLDVYRKEQFEETFPEYEKLRSYCYDKSESEDILTARKLMLASLDSSLESSAFFFNLSI